MSDRREPWRPTPPPKANSVDAGVNKPSEAIREAAQHAFNARPSTSSNASFAKSLSSGAKSAAVAAGNERKPVVAATSGQNATNTTTASFAAYARGRPPPGVERQSTNVGLLFGPVLSPTGQSHSQERPLPRGNPAQQAARMASSKSRSPAGRITYRPSSQDKAFMPQDSALLAGKLASLRSQDPGAPSSHSQSSTPPVEQPPLKLKQIPYLPRKLPAEAPPGSLAGKLAGAAAAQAAVKHAQPRTPILSPRIDASQGYFPVHATESLSPDRSTLGGSLKATSTKSTFASITESEGSSIIDDDHMFTHHSQGSVPNLINSTQRRSPGVMTSSNSAHAKEYRSGLSERTLADAIVAGSLASSRAPSPTKIDRSLMASRRARSHSHPGLPHLPHHFLHHEKVPDLATNTSQAPSRMLKQTLRKHSNHKDEDEEEITKRGRKHFMRKHPHKHHEGDRKRWRDRVTERERRRYEGVWAANRGLFTFWEEGPTFESWKRAPEHDLVVNVVVRDVWERSRLPKDVLEEIWDLVATSEDAQALQRDQFVVGLWLIDQRLKGRKLPVRVSSDVWNSVRHTQGVKISSKPY